MKLVNMMERNVLECIEKNKELISCCTCERCKADIAAYVLNRIPPKYVATEKGALYTKAANMNPDMEAQILVEVIKASDIIEKNPRHQET